MTRVLVLASAWKGSLPVAAAERALVTGVRAAVDRVRIVRLRVADGGDGTVEVLGGLLGAVPRIARVRDALGTPHDAIWSRAPGDVAVLDLASACGIRRSVARDLRPLAATTRGLGELVRAAVEDGARTIWIGLGGSASTDAGAGAAAALGARLFDESGRELPDGGAALVRLARIDRSDLDRRIAGIRFLLLRDVHAPLLGRQGAARTFGPQKGATPAQVRVLEEGLARFAAVAGIPDALASSGGAAGGAAAGLGWLLGGRLLPGAGTILDLARCDAILAHVDAVVCAEGRFDGALHEGKVNDEIVRRALRSGTPVAIVCGSVSRRLPAQRRGVTVHAGGRRLSEQGIARLARQAIRGLLR